MLSQFSNLVFLHTVSQILLEENICLLDLLIVNNEIPMTKPVLEAKNLNCSSSGSLLIFGLRASETEPLYFSQKLFITFRCNYGYEI